MSKMSIFSVRSVGYAVIFSLLLISVSAAAPTPDKESRAGIPASYSGPVSAVAAIVDDKVITTFDVQQRVKLMIISSGRNPPPEMLPQLQQRALHDLVEEKLKLGEAKKMEVKVEDKEVEKELNNIAASGGATVPQLEEVLTKAGVSMASLRQEIRASIAWPRLVSGRYGNRVHISDKEVDATIERMREDATNEQYLVSEICIPVPDPSQAPELYKGSLNLIEQMRKGVPFAVVAQQFSACTTAAAGGDLGWVRAGELPPEIDEVIRTLPPHSVTNPIPSEGTFMIMAVRDKREAAVAGEPTFTLAYASAPLSMGRNEAIQSLEKLKTADACGGRAMRQDLGPNIGVALIENAKLGDIDERFRSSIEDLNRGDLSGPIEADGYMHEVYVCEKDEGLGIPSRSAVEDRIYSHKLERIGQQYLRDVERNAMVDIRMKPTTATPNG